MFPNFQWLSLVVPTASLLYLMNVSADEPAYNYVEKLGNPSVYLSLSYATHPQGPLAHRFSGEKIGVRGVLVDGEHEMPVEGYVENIVGPRSYHLQFDGGRMDMSLLKNSSRCEPSFAYDLKTQKSAFAKYGVIRGSFCLNDSPTQVSR